MNNTSRSLTLRAGEWVEVRSAHEILATLDENHCVDGLPFMPEMLRYCGKRFRVFKSAHKTADTIELFSIRRMENAVHLADLRCDGSAHGGCQAGCLLFWKNSWLKRVADGPNELLTGGEVTPRATELSASDLKRLAGATESHLSSDKACHYRCQATEMLRATSEVRRRDRWNPFFYTRDLTSGNVGLVDFLRFGVLAMLNAFLRRWFNMSIPSIRGLAGDKTPTLELNLQPGDWVRVRSKAEIMRTLNAQQRNRGMRFDAEMLPYCGRGPFRVLRRVARLIDEKTGAMIELKNPCLILAGVTCSGNYLYQRMFSPRNEYMYFREIWLERVSVVHDKPAGVTTARSS